MVRVPIIPQPSQSVERSQSAARGSAASCSYSLSGLTRTAATVIEPRAACACATEIRSLVVRRPRAPSTRRTLRRRPARRRRRSWRSRGSALGRSPLWPRRRPGQFQPGGRRLAVAVEAVDLKILGAWQWRIQRVAEVAVIIRCGPARRVRRFRTRCSVTPPYAGSMGSEQVQRAVDTKLRPIRDAVE